MDWFHIAADMGQNIAILVCLYLIWDLRKEVGALKIAFGEVTPGARYPGGRRRNAAGRGHRVARRQSGRERESPARPQRSAQVWSFG